MIRYKTPEAALQKQLFIVGEVMLVAFIWWVAASACLVHGVRKVGFLQIFISSRVNDETEESSSDHFVNSTLGFVCTSVPIVREALP